MDAARKRVIHARATQDAHRAVDEAVQRIEEAGLPLTGKLIEAYVHDIALPVLEREFLKDDLNGLFEDEGSSLPLLSTDRYAELYAYVNKLVNRSGCSHTLRRTRTWLKKQGVDVRANIEKIADLGGLCDCEVLMNVTPSEWAARREADLVTPDIVGESASGALVSRLMLQSIQHTFGWDDGGEV